MLLSMCDLSLALNHNLLSYRINLMLLSYFHNMKIPCCYKYSKTLSLSVRERVEVEVMRKWASL